MTIRGHRYAAVPSDLPTRRAWVHDLRSGESRPFEGIPAPSMFSIAAGGRTLALSRARLESDIWMLELAEE